MTDAVKARLLRRELHSPRTTVAVVAAIVVLAGCAYLGTEIVLAMLGAPPQLGDALVALADAPVAAVGVAGGVALLLGLALVVVASAPGRRARRALAGTRAVVVADDVVIASALARAVAREAGVHPDRVTVAVSRRAATARVVPLSGTPIDVAAVTAVMQAELDRDRVDPPLRAAVRVADAGRVGG